MPITIYVQKSIYPGRTKSGKRWDGRGSPFSNDIYWRVASRKAKEGPFMVEGDAEHEGCSCLRLQPVQNQLAMQFIVSNSVPQSIGSHRRVVVIPRKWLLQCFPTQRLRCGHQALIRGAKILEPFSQGPISLAFAEVFHFPLTPP